MTTPATDPGADQEGERPKRRQPTELQLLAQIETRFQKLSTGGKVYCLERQKAIMEEEL